METIVLEPEPPAPPAGGLRAEIEAVVRLATPVVLVQLGMMLLGIVDTMMLGRLSGEALAAGSLGNTVTFAVGIGGMGLLMALDPLVAQAYGAQDHARVATHFERGTVLALALTVPMSLVMWYAEPALILARQKPELAADASIYLRYLVPGNAAFLLFVVFRQTIQAMSVVWPAVLAMAVANVFNVVANYALVFGHFGFPALGLVGSAIATTVSRWVMCLGVLVASWRILSPYWRGVRFSALDPRRYTEMLGLGLPIALHISLEMWIFAAVGLMMGSLGAIELAGHQIALNLASLSFMVPLGISAAAATRVGNAIGRRDQVGAQRSATVCLTLGAAVMGGFGLLFYLLPWPLARAFTPEADVLAVAVILLPIAAIFQVADGVQVVASGILRGTADTRIPAVIALVGFWIIGLPLGMLLGFRLAWGPPGLWWGLTAGLSSVALLLAVRTRIRLSASLDRLLVRSTAESARLSGDV